jgi:hypothetical protein
MSHADLLTLAQQLQFAQPVEPVLPKRPQGSDISGLMASCAAVLTCSVSYVAGVFVVALFHGTFFNDQPTGNLECAILCIIFLVSCVIFAFSATRIAMAYKRWSQRSVDEQWRGELASLQPKVAAYTRAKERWEATYYSLACGSVFIPGEERFMPVKQMAAQLE